MQKYVKIMIWTQYAKICNKNKQKYAVKYAKYAFVHTLHDSAYVCRGAHHVADGKLRPGGLTWNTEKTSSL